jgi:NADH-quinone oxidoreductase subunit J
VAAIALTLRRRKDTKYQDPAQQIAVRRNDRLRIIPVAADTKLMRKQEETQQTEQTS